MMHIACEFLCTEIIVNDALSSHTGSRRHAHPYSSFPHTHATNQPVNPTTQTLLKMTMRAFVENNYTKKEITLLPKYIPLYVMEI